jgi:hypothetical protein
VKNNHENGEISKSVEGVFQAEGLATEGQAIIEESRREVVNINNQGVILAKNGDFQGGVNLLRAAAQKLPNNEVILVNLCGLLIALMSKSGKSDALAQETRDLLDRVQLLNPASKKYHAYVGTLNRIMGGKLFT